MINLVDDSGLLTTRSPNSTNSLLICSTVSSSELIRYSNDPNLACRRSWKFLCDSRAHCLLCYWSEIRTTGYDRAQKLATSLRSSSTSSAGTLALTILLRFPGRFPLLADECYRGFMLLNFQGNPQMFLNLPWKSSISNGIPVILNNESPERGCL